MNYKLKELSIGNKGFYGIGASSCDFKEEYPQYLRITDINDFGYAPSILSTSINPYEYLDWNKYILKENDLLFARTGNSTGRNYLYKKDGKPTVFAGFLIKFSLNPNLVEPSYVGYYCQSKHYWNQIKSLFTGSTRANVNAEQYGELAIPVPERCVQQHIVNTIGSVDNLIENYQSQIYNICSILEKALTIYETQCTINEYDPEIIKSGIVKFDKEKTYLDTSCVEGINNISSGELITYAKRPSRANMQPIPNSVWFAKMKDSNKIIVIIGSDEDLLNKHILSTGFLGIKSSDSLPMSLLTAMIISNDFKIQRNLNSVGTTMAGVNNETFLKIQVPQLDKDEILDFDNKYSPLVMQLSMLRRKINLLKEAKDKLLKKYF